MKTTTLIFVLFLSINNYAQESDSAELRVTYEYAFINDTTTMVITKDITHLLIGNQYSYYFSYLLYRRDSLITIERQKGAGVQEMMNFIFNYDNHGTPERIYKKKHTDSLILTTSVPNALYRINDKVNFNWTINMDTMSVAGYLCQQATTSFRGRQYTAWFTTAIPINDGPYKFSGLPGLIMKINDSKGYFSFECIGLEVMKLKKSFDIKTDTYLPVSQSHYNELVNLYFDDKVDYAKEVMGLEYKVINGPKTPVKRKKPLSIEIF